MIGILLIHSTAAGHPAGPFLHFVVLSDEGPPPSTNQMRLRSRFLNMDCGVAVVETCAKARGRIMPADITLEADEGNTGGGASVPGIINGLAACGLSAVARSVTPGPMWVMNPAWGGDIAPESSQPYLAAAVVGFSEGWFVEVLDATLAGSTQPAITGTLEEQQTTEDTLMGAIFKDDNDARRYFARNLYFERLHREIESEAVMQGCVSFLIAHGADALTAAIQDSVEGGNDEAAVRQTLGMPPV